MDQERPDGSLFINFSGFFVFRLLAVESMEGGEETMKAKNTRKDVVSLHKLSLDSRQKIINKLTGASLKNISHCSFPVGKAAISNCENIIGCTQVPLGIAGPLKIKTSAGKTLTFFVPLATTEGALAASVNRGCKATFEKGIRVLVEEVGATRGPVFKVADIGQGQRTIKFIKAKWPVLSRLTARSSGHLKLKSFSWQLIGKNLYLRFVFTTAEAMGMNMVTVATDKISAYLVKKLGIELLALSGNACIDKKPAWLNFILGRGKKVWAEALIKKEAAKKVLKANPERMVEVVNKKCWLGSAVSGASGLNSHFANMISALFIATGQDPAHVVEGSLGATSAELINGDLYFSIYLPSLMVGTVGGGTGLPTQKEALALLSLEKGKSGDALKLAEVIGAVVLAGELSLIAALASHDLSRVHQALRKRQQ